MARKMAVVLCLSMACGAAFAVTPPTPVDGVVTLNVASGKTTYDAAISSEATKVVKIGAGEALLTVASPDFAGTVEVQAGTLSISDYNALGAGGMPVTVTSGASFMLKGARAANQNTPCYVGKITIAGTGVNDAGAFSFAPTNNTSGGLSDSCLQSLELSADALITASTTDSKLRSGFKNGTLELNGHRLSISGNYNFNMTTFSAGEIELVDGTAIIENTNYYPGLGPDDLKFIRRAGAKGNMQLYNSLPGVPATWELYASVNGQAGASPRNSLTGPVYLKANAALSGVTFLGVDGPVYLEGHSLNKYQAGETQYGGPIYGDTPGSGISIFSGVVTLTGNVDRTVLGDFKMNSRDRPADNTKDLIPLFDVKEGRCEFGTFNVGGSSGRGVVRISGGAEINVVSSSSFGFDTGSEYYGSGTLLLEDGAYRSGRTCSFGVGSIRNDSPQSFFLQSGGYFCITNILSSPSSYLIFGWGKSVMHVTGGTNSTITVPGNTTCYGRIYAGAYTNAQCCVSVEGPETVVQTDTIVFGNVEASNVVFSIRDGAVFKAKRFMKNINMRGSRGVFSFISDGGVLMPLFGWGWGNYSYNASDPTAAGSSYWAKPDHSVILEGGLVIDTSECFNTQGTELQAVEPAFIFENPSGKSIESISLPTSAEFLALSFREPSHLVIEGAGHGAVAYANVDLSTRTLKAPTIASPGTGYDDNTRVYVLGPYGTNRYECSFTLAERQCGPLVKRGGAMLRMNIPGNTYTGGTHVVSGSVRFENNSFPQGTPVVLGDADGNSGTLDFTSSPAITLSSLGGKGTVTGYSSLTISNVVLDARRLASGGTATVACSGAASFADGATLKIENPECLASAESQRYDIMTATSMSGAVTLEALDESVAGKWRLQNMGDRLRLAKVRGFVITVE